jgi:hypothetical protein
MRAISTITNLPRKAPNSIRVFLISIIGPKTRKAESEPIENVLRNEEAMKASASEQSDIVKASPIITREAINGLLPRCNRYDVGMNVCMQAAMNAPNTKYLPTEKNSSIA